MAAETPLERAVREYQEQLTVHQASRFLDPELPEYSEEVLALGGAVYLEQQWEQLLQGGQL